MINEPKSTPHDNAPKAIGIVVKPTMIIFANFTNIKKIRCTGFEPIMVDLKSTVLPLN